MLPEESSGPGASSGSGPNSSGEVPGKLVERVQELEKKLLRSKEELRAFENEYRQVRRLC